MRTRIALALLFVVPVALCAFGQTFQRSLPFLAKSGTAELPVPPVGQNTAIWWFSSDLGTDGLFSTWDDRIQGKRWQVYNGGTMTGGSNGVVFAVAGNTPGLTNGSSPLAPHFYATNYAMVFNVLVSRAPDGVNGRSYAWFGITNNATGLYWTYSTAGTCSLKDYNANIITKFNTNEWYDIVFMVTNSGISGNAVVATNGVIFSTTSAYYFGSLPTQLGSGVVFTFGFTGIIKDVYIRTNVLSVVAPDYTGAASNAHYFRTNTYGI